MKFIYLALACLVIAAGFLALVGVWQEEDKRKAFANDCRIGE